MDKDAASRARLRSILAALRWFSPLVFGGGLAALLYFGDAKWISLASGHARDPLQSQAVDLFRFLLPIISVLAGGFAATASYTIARRLRRISFLDDQVQIAQANLSGQLTFRKFATAGDGAASEEPTPPTDSGNIEPRRDRKTGDEQVGPAWNLALLTLERYWERNLAQNGSIYLMSVVACGLGFFVMLWGSYSAIQGNVASSAAILTAVSGAVTEVLGATFLFIYKSTADQASAFNRTLERINAAGMAWYVIESMSDSGPTGSSQKDTAKLALASQIVSAVSLADSNASAD